MNGAVILSGTAIRMPAGYAVEFNGSLLLLAALLFAAAIIAVTAYRQTIPPTGRMQRIALGFLRILALGMLIFLIFEPSISRRREHRMKPLVTVLIDDSQSMALNEASGARAEKLKRLLQDPIWNTLRRKFDLAVFAAGDSLRELGSMQFDSLHFEAMKTDLAAGWQGVLRKEKAHDAGALILISDGGDNAGRDPVQAAGVAKIPIYVIGVGDTAEVRDASILRVDSDEYAYRGKETQITAVIKARGMEGYAGVLELTDEEGRILAKANLRLPPDDLEMEQSLRFTPTQTGTQPLTLRLQSSGEERGYENNQRVFPLRVLESRLKVLVISGQPSFESLFFLRTIAAASDARRDIELSAVTRKGDGEFFGLTGSRLENAVTKADVLVLQDLPAENDAATSWRQIQSALSKRKTPIWFWFSVKPNPTGLQELAGEIPFSVAPIPAPGAAEVHPIGFYTEIAPDLETSQRDLWADLPPVQAPPFSVKTNSSVQVLLACKDPQTGMDFGPAWITWESAGRRFAASFGSGYWKWSFVTQGLGGSDELYRSMINGVLQWLASPPENRPLIVKTIKEVYSTGENVRLEAKARGGDGNPVLSAQVEVKIEGPDGETRVILEPSVGGVYSGAFRPNAVGSYAYRALAYGDADTLGTDSGSILVEAYNVEMEAMRQDVALLQEIARVSGGGYFPADSSARLADVLELPPRLAVSEWNRRFFLNWDIWGILIGALALEWVLRKRKGML
jgi:hypothetical protein